MFLRMVHANTLAPPHSESPPPAPPSASVARRTRRTRRTPGRIPRSRKRPHADTARRATRRGRRPIGPSSIQRRSGQHRTDDDGQRQRIRPQRGPYPPSKAPHERLAIRHVFPIPREAVGALKEDWSSRPERPSPQRRARREDGSAARSPRSVSSSVPTRAGREDGQAARAGSVVRTRCPGALARSARGEKSVSVVEDADPTDTTHQPSLDRYLSTNESPAASIPIAPPAPRPARP